jgi:hypothetical protein
MPEWKNLSGVEGFQKWRYPISMNPDLLDRFSPEEINQIVTTVQGEKQLEECRQGRGQLGAGLRNAYKGVPLVVWLATIGNVDVMFLDTAERFDSQGERN